MGANIYIIKALLDDKKNQLVVGYQNKEGDTALIWACINNNFMNNNKRIVKLLLVTGYSNPQHKSNNIAIDYVLQDDELYNIIKKYTKV